MKAVRFTGPGRAPIIEDVPIPQPGPGQVLVKIGGAGVCHSDLHVLDHGVVGAAAFTLGHENAGWVAGLGAGVTGLKEGDPVAVYGFWGCGHCHACQLSMESYCENADTLPHSGGGGLGLDGGMAEYMLVPSPRLLVPLGKLVPREAAALTDAALTPYHAIKRGLHLLTPDATVVAIGIGGLGHMAVQLLRVLCGARIVAVDLDDRKLEHAKRLGADLTVNSRDAAGAVETIRRFCGPRRAALVLDFVGVQASLDLAVQLVGSNSQLTVVGVGGGTIQLSQMTLPFGCAVSTPLWGSRAELMEVVALAQSGRIHVDATYFSVEQGPQVLQDLREGKVFGRGVLVPDVH